jgi:hypothetical protein
MQNVVGEGDFEHYQGVWRMQSLPNCNPTGGSAARLTYAVEIKPKGMLPVRLIEGRIAADLKANMAAIRDFVEEREERKLKEKAGRAAAKAAVLVDTPATDALPRASVDVDVDVNVAPVLDPESSSFLEAIQRGAAGARSDEELARMAAQILAQAQAQAATALSMNHAAVEATGPLETADVEPATAPVDAVDVEKSITGLFVRKNVKRILGSFRRSSGDGNDADPLDATATVDEPAPSPSEEALAEENARLRAKLAILESEITAACDVLQQIGNTTSRRDT